MEDFAQIPFSISQSGVSVPQCLLFSHNTYVHCVHNLPVLSEAPVYHAFFKVL